MTSRTKMFNKKILLKCICRPKTGTDYLCGVFQNTIEIFIAVQEESYRKKLQNRFFFRERNVSIRDVYDCVCLV